MLTTIFPFMSSCEKLPLSSFDSNIAVDEASSCKIKLTFNRGGNLEVVVEMELLALDDPETYCFRFVLFARLSPFSRLLLSSSSMKNGLNDESS